MIETVQRKNSGFLAIIFLTLVVVIWGGWFSWSNFHEVRNHQKWVDHTHRVINEIETTVGHVREAESLERGFILSGKESFLDPFHQSANKALVHQAILEGLVADNPVQAANAQKLRQLVGERLSILERVTQVYKQNGLTSAIRTANIQQGQQVMATLRAHGDNMKQFEQDLLVSRNSSVEKSEDYFNWSLLAVTVLTVITMGGAYTQIHRNQKETLDEADRRARDSWMKGRLADASKVLIEEQSFDRTARKVLEHLAQITPLLAANFYWSRSRNLQLVASYGGSTGAGDAPVLVSLQQGGGLLVEAFRKAAVTRINSVPENYFSVRSSLGGSKPSHLVFMPVVFQGRNLGVIEMASFEEFPSEMFELLDSLGETLGIGLNAAQSREEMQQLLERTQQQAEELQTQQEELRTTNEELEQQARILETQQHSLSERNQDLELARREVETKARELQRESAYKSDFMAKMSHELRTPLNSLLILATLLIENKEKNLTPQQKDFARSISGAGNDLLNLINDILDLSKIEARKMVMRPEIFTLRTFFGNIEGIFAAQCEAKGLKLKMQLPLNLAEKELNTDRQRLEQIIRNFLSNAVKFTEKGHVGLSARLDDKTGLLELTVDDTGIGIPPEKRDLIFEAFEQADGSISRKFGGTGLGLTISKELAALLGGHISVESGEGPGSAFTVRLPIDLPEEQIVAGSMPAVPAPEQLPSATPEFPTKGSLAAKGALKGITQDARSILIVEDETGFRESVAEIVKAQGFEPIQADSGDLALEILAMHTPSAILLDIKLPGVSGMAILEMVKKRPQLRHIPVHMISAMDYQQNALRMGAMGYLGKPVTLDKVRDALKRIESLISKKVKRLLVVEDDKRQREAIVQLVSGKEIEVKSVVNGEEAFAAIKGENFDCIILDLSLPDISGFDVLGKLNELNLALPPIVIYTAQELSPEREAYLRKYSESIIIKGARSPERLLDEVNLFLHRVDSVLPEEKRKMLEVMRSQDKAFDGKRILLVDDDLRNVFALTSALEGRGFSVSIARNGVEALEALAQQPQFDAVLMDLMMPKMDGLEAIRRLRQIPEYKTVPVIALTAKAMKEDHERCIAAGATDYLPKPINLNNLFSALNVWVARKDLFV